MLRKTNGSILFPDASLSFLQPGLYELPCCGVDIFAWIPDSALVRNAYTGNVFDGSPGGFPFWARPWSASLALCDYLCREVSMLRGKTVLELGAGLGLPSLVAAASAEWVHCTDLDPSPLAFVRQSAALNNFTNLQTMALDWNHVPASLQADVLLLSDINYTEAELPAVDRLIRRFLRKGATVILSTPQRLSGKDFLLGLLPFVTHSEEQLIEVEEQSTLVTLFVMKM